MLNRDAVFFKSLKNLPAEADLGIHHCLCDKNGAEALLAGNAGNGIGGLFGCAFYDPSTICLGIVGIADVDRNSLCTDRENSIFMKNGSTHVGKLTELTVGDGINGYRILDHSGIGKHKAGYICPVLIGFCSCGSSNNGAGYIRAAAGEGFNLHILTAAIEAGDNGIRHSFQTFAENLLCLIEVCIALFIKEDHFISIDKFEAKIVGKDLAVQIFSSGSRIILIGILG